MTEPHRHNTSPTKPQPAAPGVFGGMRGVAPRSKSGTAKYLIDFLSSVYGMLLAFITLAVLCSPPASAELCKKKNWELSDEDYLLAALISTSHHPAVEPRLLDAASAARYIRDNPQCCVIAAADDPFAHRTLLDRLFGSTVRVVNVTLPLAQPKKTTEYFSYVYLDACAGVVDNIGIDQ